MITLHLPNNTEFNISQEISSARNIKDTNTRKSTLAGLNRIQQYL